MMIFLICLLVVGAYANSPQPLEHLNDAFPAVHQPSLTFGSADLSGSTYTSSFGSLPIGHQTFSSSAYDNLGGQYDQGSLSGHFQQLGQGFTGGVVNSAGHQTIQSNVVDRVVKVPVSMPHPVPVTRTVQVPVPHPVPVEVRRPVKVPVPHPVPVYVTKTYQVNVDRPVPVPVPQPYEVPHPVPVPVSVPQHVPVPVQVPQHAVQINSGYEQASVGQENFGGHQDFGFGSEQQSFDFGSQQQQQQQQQHFDFGSAGGISQSFDFGGQHHDFDLGSQDHHHFGSQVDGTVDFGQNVGAAIPAKAVETSDALPVVTENKSAGYKYDVPAKKFTF